MFKINIINFLIKSIALSVVCVCLVVKLENNNIIKNMQLEMYKAKSQSEINRLLISKSLSIDYDLVSDFYKLSSFKDFNVAYENGTNVSYSEVVNNELNSQDRFWYKCAKEKKSGDYCVSNVYQNYFPPHDEVFTFSYPIFYKDKFVAVGLTDIRKTVIDGDNYISKFDYYDVNSGEVKFVFEVAPLLLSILFISLFLSILFYKSDFYIKKLNEKLKIDRMSGLKRRDVFKLDRIDSRVKAICMIDIDNFKTINDDFGHAIGDEVIVNLSKCLKNNIRDDDVLFRWGGDEFLIILRGVESSVSDINIVLERLKQSIECINKSTRVKFTTSMGFSLYISGEDINDCIRRADMALYHSKESGRDKISFFN